MARTIRVTGKGNVTAQLSLHPLLVEGSPGACRGAGGGFRANHSGEGCRSSRAASSPSSVRRWTVPAYREVPRTGYETGTGQRWSAAGTDLRTTQTLMRHAQLNTTAIYV